MVLNIEEIEDYLDIPIPSSPALILDDSRRVTGPGLLWEKPGAILDVQIDGFDKHAVVRVWTTEMENIFKAIDWETCETTNRIFDEGVNLAISAPMDLLYSAVFVIQTGWHLTASKLLGETPLDFEKLCADLREVISKEQNPALITLLKAARDQHIDVLCDDEFISVGHGKKSEKWDINSVPNPSDVNFPALGNLPVALITGTNGKSTSVRLTAAIAEAAGLVAGSTSTDFVKLGDEVLDYGDYSGPGGARMLLRDKRLDIAFLEVARGGILRRGLPLTEATSALVTNIAADHLGQYGVNTVEALATTKFAVARTLSKDGTLVLNADDTLVVTNGLKTDRQVCWFSLHPDNELVLKAKANNNSCCWLEGGDLNFFDGKAVSLTIAVADIPLTMGGAARFNVQNAMGALCLAKAMGVPDAAILQGLSTFTSTPDDNPGRCNEFNVKDAKVFVDFAHNPHSIRAIADMIGNIPGNNKFLLIGHAGDRTDQEIAELTKGALSFNPGSVVISEVEAYLRGREFGEVPALIEQECLKQGISKDSITHTGTQPEGTRFIIDHLKPGDLALMLVFSDRDEVFNIIKSAQ